MDRGGGGRMRGVGEWLGWGNERGRLCIFQGGSEEREIDRVGRVSGGIIIAHPTEHFWWPGKHFNNKDLSVFAQAYTKR